MVLSHLRQNTLIGLDGRTGEYSSFVLPATEDWPCHLWNNPVYITDGRDGKPRIFSAVDGIFKVFARLDTDGNDGEWVPPFARLISHEWLADLADKLEWGRVNLRCRRQPVAYRGTSHPSLMNFCQFRHGSQGHLLPC
jgi:hypothetical protein